MISIDERIDKIYAHMLLACTVKTDNVIKVVTDGVEPGAMDKDGKVARPMKSDDGIHVAVDLIDTLVSGCTIANSKMSNGGVIITRGSHGGGHIPIEVKVLEGHTGSSSFLPKASVISDEGSNVVKTVAIDSGVLCSALPDVKVDVDVGCAIAVNVKSSKDSLKMGVVGTVSTLPAVVASTVRGVVSTSLCKCCVQMVPGV